MIKRLSISLLLMGLAAFSLGAAAFAWFSDSGSGNVSVSSGTVDLKFSVDLNCDETFEEEDADFDDNPFAFSWDDIVPGDRTQDCIEVVNEGPNGDLTVYASHSGFDSDGAALRNATLWRYNAIGSGSVNCGFSQPHDAQYTAERGCELVTIAPGESFLLEVTVDFEDTGTNQNGLQDLEFGFDTTLTGYTG